MDILVVLENNNGSLHKMSLEAVAGAQALAKEMNLTASGFIMGKDTSSLETQAKELDLKEILIVNDPNLASYSAEGYTEVLKKVIELEGPKYVFMGNTVIARDYVPKVSTRLRIPLIGDISSYRIQDDSPVFVKYVFNGKLVADYVPAADETMLVSFQTAAFQADTVEKGTTESRILDITLDESLIKSTSEQPFQEESDGVDLSGAEIVVSVGRGISKEENLPIAEELVKALNAELGSSRPIVDAGWLPTYRQVGSSGQSVSPKLYMALGISGAIQHVVGMKGSKNIVAINKDPEAPIFEVADYGVVGDIIEIIPKLTEAING